MPEANRVKPLERLVSALDQGKKKLEPALDSCLLLGTTNLGIAYGASQICDSPDISNPTKAAVLIGTGAILAAYNYCAIGRNGKIKQFLGKINSGMDKIRPLSWLKTGALAATTVIGLTAFAPYAADIIDDIKEMIPEKKITSKQSLKKRTIRRDLLDKVLHPTDLDKTEFTIVDNTQIEKEIPVIHNHSIPSDDFKIEISKKRPAIYDHLDYDPIIEHEFFGTKLADRGNWMGRMQRALRWKPLWRAVEQKYGIPNSYLGAMIMQESFGDPVQPNMNSDGGLGVVHVQGKTAKEFGLKIYGESDSYSDSDHGAQVSDLVNDCRYDPVCVANEDERGHMLKVLDMAGRMISMGKEKHGSWKKGVQFYRGPGHVGKKIGKNYLKKVEEWRGSLRSSYDYDKAAKNFANKNPGKTLDDYLSQWHEMAENWGLAIYEGAQLKK